ncbi:MAG: DUF882 domain-containing protein [Desulfobulbus sp.]|jgi:uncharacterized protein YcbK (DUF882 family)|uniref:YcbK family protein n=1 Tax=Desulfobulbus sp. TaxID=895 RepID=UPI0028513ADF|nr:DUF882 domain-containing protein [Desulfobulbus sp.]MDR2551178.1 DUF882 domain-containing protein [Desulfobulbus sp.]
MVTEKNSQPALSRRSFLLASTQIVLGLGVVSAPTLACAKALDRRSLSFFHTRTQKELRITYASGKAYDRKALTEINRFLRDYQTGQVHVIDPKLLDILWAVQGEMGSRGIYEVISGYRSPRTNRGLRKGHPGVASHSLHMKGKAVDIRFSGGNLSQVYKCALAMQSGGIGYYPDDGFVHLDSGLFRTW